MYEKYCKHHWKASENQEKYLLIHTREAYYYYSKGAQQRIKEKQTKING